MTTNNTQIITVAHNQVVSLRDTLEVVPLFTGDNISLDQFFFFFSDQIFPALKSAFLYALPQSWFCFFPCLAQQRITLWAGKTPPRLRFDAGRTTGRSTSTSSPQYACARGEACRKAKDMHPAGAESNLTKLIKTKVTGEAL